MGDENQEPFIGATEFINLLRSGQPTPSQAGMGGNITAETFRKVLKNAPQPEGLSWLDVPVQAITNIPKSGYEFGKGMYEAVTSPVESVKSLLDVGAGTLRNITPRQIVNFIEQFEANPEAAQRASDVASQLGKFYKDRYGSSEGFKQALANDPVGVAADVSTLLTGTGAALRPAQTVGPVAKLSAALRTAGDVTNPLLATTKGAEKIVSPTLGLMTGTSAETVRQAGKAGFQAAYDRTSPFLEQLRGQGVMTQPLDDARHNLSVMRQNRSAAYRSGMVDITNDKSILDFKDIDNALNKTKAQIQFKGKVKDENAQVLHDRLLKEVDGWKAENPAEFHTPEGLDALKQRIGNIVDEVPFQQRNAVRVGKDVYDAVKNTIAKQAPKYAEVMKDYSQASEQITEIERALSLGNRASADTAMRKLQSLNRNNVYTNYGNRLNLAQTLEAEGGKPFISALAGQSLSSPTARGLAGGVEALTMLGGLYNPAYLASIPFQTPRIVGEAAYAGGRAARPVVDISRQLGVTPAKALALSDLLKTSRELNPENVTYLRDVMRLGQPQVGQ